MFAMSPCYILTIYNKCNMICNIMYSYTKDLYSNIMKIRFILKCYNNDAQQNGDQNA